MSEVTMRRATGPDLPEIDALFRRSFADTFGHLYAEEDLAAFFAMFTPEAWQEEFDDPGHAFLVAEANAPPLDEEGLEWGDVSEKGRVRSTVTPPMPSPIKGEDSQIIGYIKLGPPAFPIEIVRPAIELRQIYFDRAWLGRGLARPMMDWAIDEARRRGAEEMYLSVFIENHRAQALYNRYGFTEVGPYKFMVGNHADEDIIMRLEL